METEPWHLSKSVPLSIIFAVVVQTGTLIWFIAGLDASVSQNARDLTRHEGRLEMLEASVQAQALSIARMDTNIQYIRDILERSERHQ
jgi:cell division protein FtsB